MNADEPAEDIVDDIGRELADRRLGWDGLDSYDLRVVRKALKRLAIKRILAYCEQMEVE